MAKEKKITEQPQAEAVITAIYNGAINTYKNIGAQVICFTPGKSYTLPAANAMVLSMIAQKLLSIQNN